MWASVPGRGSLPWHGVRNKLEQEDDGLLVPKVARPEQSSPNLLVFSVGGFEVQDATGAMMQTKVDNHPEGHAAI